MERMIVLSIGRPDCCSIDLVDLPGWCQVAKTERERYMPEDTGKLKEFVKALEEYSFFLIVLPAGTSLESQAVMQIVQSGGKKGEGIQNRSLGVYTKCDKLERRGLRKRTRTVGVSPSAVPCASEGPARSRPSFEQTPCLTTGARPRSSARDSPSLTTAGRRRVISRSKARASCRRSVSSKRLTRPPATRASCSLRLPCARSYDAARGR